MLRRAAFGARVDRGPAPVHGKATPIHHTGEDLFEGVPDPFEGGRYHSLVKEFRGIPVLDDPKITFAPTADSKLKAPILSGVGGFQVNAPSCETRATMREEDQVGPCRVTLKSQTTPSGACQTTALPSGHFGRGLMRSGLDHAVSPWRRRAP